MRAEENKAVVRRYVEEVWNRHDLDAIDGLVSPGYFNHAAGTVEYRRGGARSAVEWLLSVFPDHRFDVEDVAADGETVALRGTMTGTRAQQGREGEIHEVQPCLSVISGRHSVSEWHDPHFATIVAVHAGTTLYLLDSGMGEQKQAILDIAGRLRGQFTELMLLNSH